MLPKTSVNSSGGTKIVFSHNKTYQMFLSEPIVSEFLDVLRRPELTGKFKQLENMDFPEVLDILGQAPIVEISKIPTVSRDFDDNKFIATAVEAGAGYLVTEDYDLLDIKEYKGIKIINAGVFFKHA